jgi:hypothetical protein
MMNKFLHLLPPDFNIREIAVIGLWYAPGQFRAARYLWETMRWLCKERGTTLIGTFDSRDDTKRVVNIQPWHQPRPTITLALRGPSAIDRKKLVFIPGRV